PLTFSQQMRWNMINLESRRSARELSIAMRLLGELNVQLLRKSFLELVRRHESLRTRIVSTDGIPTQAIDDTQEFDLEIVDLTAVAEADRDTEARRLVRGLVDEWVDVAVGPLFAAKLVKLT